MNQPQAPVAEPAPQVVKPEKPEAKISTERIGEEYGMDKIQDLTGGKERSSAIILGLNQLDDDSICDTLEKYPAYQRNRRIIDNVRNGAYDTGQHNIPSSTGSGTTFSY